MARPIEMIEKEEPRLAALAAEKGGDSSLQAVMAELGMEAAPITIFKSDFLEGSVSQEQHKQHRFGKLF